MLGNDYVNEYLLDGTLSKFLSALSKDKVFNYELNDSYYELDICGLYACVKFIQDLETLGIDVKDLNGSSALYFMYATYKDTYFSLLKSGGQDVLRSTMYYL